MMDAKLKFEYEQTITTWRMLADIRFKLLALVPAFSSIAIAVLADSLFAKDSSIVATLLVALIGFLITIGIVFYDQRNSQLSNQAYFHAKELERQMQLPLNGALSSRPGRTLSTFGIKIWHDRGLALIYGSVLSGWLFLIVYAGALWLNISETIAVALSSGLFILALVVFIRELHRLDKVASENPYFYCQFDATVEFSGSAQRNWTRLSRVSYQIP